MGLTPPPRSEEVLGIVGHPDSLGHPFRGSMMSGKWFFALIALVLLAISPAAAQRPGTTYRLGFLTIGASNGPVTLAVREAIIEALAKRNYTVGANLSVESRFAEGTLEKLPMLTQELVGDRVDAIIAHGDLAAHVAKEGTERIPIVAFSIGDPVATGLGPVVN